jgi:hypothetical protein
MSGEEQSERAIRARKTAIFWKRAAPVVLILMVNTPGMLGLLAVRKLGTWHGLPLVPIAETLSARGLLWWEAPHEAYFILFSLLLLCWFGGIALAGTARTIEEARAAFGDHHDAEILGMLEIVAGLLVYALGWCGNDLAFGLGCATIVTFGFVRHRFPWKRRSGGCFEFLLTPVLLVGMVLLLSPSSPVDQSVGSDVLAVEQSAAPSAVPMPAQLGREAPSVAASAREKPPEVTEAPSDASASVFILRMILTQYLAIGLIISAFMVCVSAPLARLRPRRERLYALKKPLILSSIIVLIGSLSHPPAAAAALATCALVAMLTGWLLRFEWLVGRAQFLLLLGAIAAILASITQVNSLMAGAAQPVAGDIPLWAWSIAGGLCGVFVGITPVLMLAWGYSVRASYRRGDITRAIWGGGGHLRRWVLVVPLNGGLGSGFALRSSFRRVERATWLMITARLADPLAVHRTIRTVSIPDLEKLFGTPLEGLVRAMLAKPKDRAELGAAASLLTRTSELHGMAWMMNPELFEHEILDDPAGTLQLLESLRRSERCVQLELYWSWLQLQAFLLHGDVARFSDTLSRLIERVASEDLEEALGAGEWGDQVDPNATVGPVLLKSSEVRARCGLRLLEATEELRAMAEMGGDRAVLLTVHRFARQTERALGVLLDEVPTELSAELTMRREWRKIVRARSAMEEEAEGADVPSPVDQLDAIARFWYRWGYAPLLARAGSEGLPLTARLVVRWWMERWPADAATRAAPDWGDEVRGLLETGANARSELDSGAEVQGEVSGFRTQITADPFVERTTRETAETLAFTSISHMRWDLEPVEVRTSLDTLCNLIGWEKILVPEPWIETSEKTTSTWLAETDAPMVPHAWSELLPFAARSLVRQWIERWPTGAATWSPQVPEDEVHEQPRARPNTAPEVALGEEARDEISAACSLVTADLLPLPLGVDAVDRATVAMLKREAPGVLASICVADVEWKPEPEVTSTSLGALLGRIPWEKVLVRAPWMESPGMTTDTWLAAAVVALRAGHPEEARKLHQQAAWFVHRHGRPGEEHQLCALGQRLFDTPGDIPTGRSFHARRSRVQTCEEELRSSTTVDDFVRAAEVMAGGQRGDSDDLCLGKDDTLIVQALLPEGIKTATIYGQLPPESRELRFRKIPRRKILEALADLREQLHPEFSAAKDGYREPAEQLGRLLMPDQRPRNGTLYYVGLGALNRCPLSALPWCDGILGREQAWVRCLRPSFVGPVPPPRATGHAALWWDKGEVPLPQVRGECAALEGFRAGMATRATLLDALSTDAAVHLACHGRSSVLDDREAHLLLSDGEVTAHQLRNHEVRTPMVYLSACETAQGSLIPGETAAGLAGALLSAGAKRVVATQWVLTDEAAPKMAKSFWRDLAAGVTAPQSLLRARQQSPDHPMYWSGLELIQ